MAKHHACTFQRHMHGRSDFKLAVENHLFMYLLISNQEPIQNKLRHQVFLHGRADLCLIRNESPVD